MKNHPVGKSHYQDGSLPNGTDTTASSTSDEEQGYMQPEIEVQEMANANKPGGKDGEKSLCEQLEDDGSLDFGVTEWISKNSTPLIIAGVVYGGYRMLRSNKSKS